MPPTRVLVVDDAVVVRRLISEALSGDPDIEVVGTAANGRIALQRIRQCNPDVVTLDVEMPEMDGLETLRHLRAEFPSLPVIMCSTLTERGASITMDALALGATDYITKPSQTGSFDESMQRFRDDLLPRVKALSRRAPASGSIKPFVAKSAGLRAEPVRIIAIGVSTGGPNALSVLMPRLRPDLDVPVVIVQHMPPMFTRLLAERLDAHCPLSVKESAGGELLRAGSVYIAPGGFHMVLTQLGGGVATALNQAPQENSCRPAVDVLFRTVASIYGAGTLGVILTGMGQDGLRGCQEIHERGGRILAQDEASSVVWGMPGFVAKAGLADKVLPLDAIAAEINRLAGDGPKPRVAGPLAAPPRAAAPS